MQLDMLLCLQVSNKNGSRTLYNHLIFFFAYLKKIKAAAVLCRFFTARSSWLVARGSQLYQQNVMKDPHWYAVQGSDTTMLTKAVALFGQ